MKRSVYAILIFTAASLYSCSDSGNNAKSAKSDTTLEQTTDIQAKTPEASVVKDPIEVTDPAVGQTTPNSSKPESGADNEVISEPMHLNAATFKEKVFNYEKNPQVWKFEGDKPCIIDFYADWCKPCKLVAPIMDDLAKKYAGQIVVYKVDTQKEKELAQVFGIRSIPSVLFCPTEGKPQMTQGALPRETFEEVVQNFLLAEQPLSE